MAISRRQLLTGGLGVAGASVLAACGNSSSSSSATTVAPAGSDLGAVEHVIFLMQENRSFDHYFGSYRGVRGFNDRSPGALRAFHQPWPAGTDGATTLLPYNLASATTQICAGNVDVPIHNWAPQHQSWNQGRNDRFVAVHAESANDGPAEAPLVMGYFTRNQLPYYYALADAFTICDRYFCSVIGPTMPNRLYWMSGFIDPQGRHGGPVLETPNLGSQAADAVGSVSWPTMPEALSDHGVSWKVYQTPGTSVGSGMDNNLALGFNTLLYFKQYLAHPGSDLYQRAFIPSWPDDFTSDIASGNLPQVSWVLPPLAYSEHPNSSPAAGQWFVSQVLSALTAHPEVWSKTVLFVMYDENGGFFDHVAPPTPPPGTPGEEVSAAQATSQGNGVAGPIGLGFRVPMLVLSPWSRGGWVDSNVYDHTSQLRFLEERFGVKVPNLTPWRRETVGNLTASLGLATHQTTRPALPSTSIADLGSACPTATNIAAFLEPPEPVNVPNPGHQQLPGQEPGRARRR